MKNQYIINAFLLILFLERSGLCDTPSLPSSEVVNYNIKIDVFSNEVSPGIPVVIFLSSEPVKVQNEYEMHGGAILSFFWDTAHELYIRWQGNMSKTQKEVHLLPRYECCCKEGWRFSKGIPTVPLSGGEAKLSIMIVKSEQDTNMFVLSFRKSSPVESVIVGDRPTSLVNYDEFQNLILFGKKQLPLCVENEYPATVDGLPRLPPLVRLEDHFSPVEIERIVAAARQNDPLALILLLSMNKQNYHNTIYSPQCLSSDCMSISEILRRSENIPAPAREYIYICIYEELRQREFNDSQIINTFPCHPAVLRSFFSQRADAISQRINAGFASSPATEFTIYQKAYHLRYYIIVLILIITAVQIHWQRKNGAAEYRPPL